MAAADPLDVLDGLGVLPASAGLAAFAAPADFAGRFDPAALSPPEAAFAGAFFFGAAAFVARESVFAGDLRAVFAGCFVALAALAGRFAAFAGRFAAFAGRLAAFAGRLAVFAGRLAVFAAFAGRLAAFAALPAARFVAVFSPVDLPVDFAPRVALPAALRAVPEALPPGAFRADVRPLLPGDVFFAGDFLAPFAAEPPAVFLPVPARVAFVPFAVRPVPFVAVFRVEPLDFPADLRADFAAPPVFFAAD